MRLRKKALVSSVVDHDSRPDEMMPGMMTTACFFSCPRDLTERPTSKLLALLLSHSRPGARTSVKLRPAIVSDGKSVKSDLTSYESTSMPESDLSGSPSESSQVLRMPSRPPMRKTKRLRLQKCL